jgi:folylpolyglutamate synthase/dihydropteroate synthase
MDHLQAYHSHEDELAISQITDTVMEHLAELQADPSHGGTLTTEIIMEHLEHLGLFGVSVAHLKSGVVKAKALAVAHANQRHDGKVSQTKAAVIAARKPPTSTSPANRVTRSSDKRSSNHSSNSSAARTKNSTG